MREQFLSRIVQPDIFFILLIVGVLGLYTEFTHPGVVAPGVIGGICMVLALYAMHILPVNIAGLVSDGARAGAIYSGGEVHEPRCAGGWRHRGHAAGRADADSLAAHVGAA